MCAFSLDDLKNRTKTPTVANLKALKKQLTSYSEMGFILPEQAFWLEQMDEFIAIAEQSQHGQEQSRQRTEERDAKPPNKKFRFNCPSCGRSIRTNSSNVGRTARCQGCQCSLVVPSESQEAPIELQGG